MFVVDTFLGILSSMVVIWSTGSGVKHDSNLLAHCAVRLLNTSNLSRKTVYVTMSSEVSHDFRTKLLSSMHRTHNPTLLLHHFIIKPFNPNIFILPHAYLVAARTVSDLVDHLDTINVTAVSWRPRVIFIVALETPTEATKNALEPVFRRFWFNNMFRSVLLVPKTAATGTVVNALAWYPFRRRCGEYHTPNTVNTCVGRLLDDGGYHISYLWRNVSNMFSGRIPKTFYNCTVKIAGFHWPPLTLLSNHTPRRMVRGMDVEAVRLMSRIGRVKLELIEVEHDQRWGVMLENGTWDGGFGALGRHGADFLIPGGIMMFNRIERFDWVSRRQVIQFSLFTPLPRKLPYWQNMLKVFSYHFWLTLFAVFGLTSGLLWLAGSHLPSERRPFADPGHCLIISWAILCSVGCGGQPPTSISSKMIYMSWVIYVLHISAVYTSMQLIYLYKPKYEQPMRTIDDVKRSGLMVCCVPTFIPIAHAMSVENFNLTEFAPCTDMVESANQLLRKKDVIILDPEDHFEALVPIMKEKVNKVDEVVIVYNIGIYMQKGNPFMGILTKAQTIAYEAGLHVKWREDASPSPPLKKHQINKVKKLNVDELQGAFIILICGLYIGLVIFIFEWCFGPN